MACDTCCAHHRGDYIWKTVILRFGRNVQSAAASFCYNMEARRSKLLPARMCRVTCYGHGRHNDYPTW